MPKIPGRKSTRRTVVGTEGLSVGSFIMQHEERYWRRVCVVSNCEHRMGPKVGEPGWADWEACHKNALPAFVYWTDDLDAGPVGMTCPCHTAEILGY